MSEKFESPEVPKSAGLDLFYDRFRAAFGGFERNFGPDLIQAMNFLRADRNALELVLIMTTPTITRGEFLQIAGVLNSTARKKGASAADIQFRFPAPVPPGSDFSGYFTVHKNGVLMITTG